MVAERPDVMPKVRDLPHKPGVYLFKDRFNRVIYVGKARDLQKRVSQYFHPGRQHHHDRKTLALLESIWDLEAHTVKSEPESLLLEGKLIKEFRPRYNVSFRDDKKFLLVKVNLNDPFPRFQLTRVKKDDGARYFGPFPHAGSLRKTLALVRKKFHIRTCRPEIPGEIDYKHCLQHIIKNCSAPCVNKITRAGYLAKVREACEFLDGASGEMAAEFKAEMEKAAARLDFERAAEIRNLLDDLKRTTRPTKRFARQFVTTVRPSEDVAALQEALGLAEAPAIIECFDISNISTTHKVASMVCFRGGKPDRENYRRYRIKTVEGQDDFASMAEVVRRRYARVLGEGIRRPGLIVVDGGKGQLGSAKRELDALGLGDLPVIGLAKEREEIFRPGQSAPLALDPSSGAIRLLQRIRDEAHRFANAYHQILMKQRVSESLLDDCPGVSENRKKLLLRHFGSIEKLRHATAEEICAVEGIGPKLAGTLVDFFAKLKRRGARSGDENAGDETEAGVVTYRLKPQL
ncbi:MAG TPA: excinuclease ABC subunit UvrC [Candidatus Methylacidiphilales bacterium]|jgi:excinuclease ABC subunit C|nr:excinuclease ABC subunit UvrC [Candidatus Methylacidiphilales bacterium]